MLTLVEDLQTDTAMLKKSIIAVSDRIKHIDSVLLYLYHNPGMKSTTRDFFRIAARALFRLNIVFTDRTSTQLKNAGGMRLVREKNVADAIVNYWNQIEFIKDLMERYHIYREEGRSLSSKFTKYYEFYISNQDSSLDKKNSYPLINNDPAIISEYGNIVAFCGILLRPNFQNALDAQLQNANELIKLIREEYHLK